MITALILFVSTFAQSAAFTLVSRARNSNSLGFHAVASAGSNFVYQIVLRQVVTHLDSPLMRAAYVLASTMGGVAMHWFSMRHIERRVQA